MMNRQQERLLQVIREDLRKCSDKQLEQRRKITETVLKLLEDEEEERRRDKNG